MKSVRLWSIRHAKWLKKGFGVRVMATLWKIASVRSCLGPTL